MTRTTRAGSGRTRSDQRAASGDVGLDSADASSESGNGRAGSGRRAVSEDAQLEVGGAEAGATDVDDASVLVIADHGNATKIERHWGPLADIAGDVTMVCTNADPDVERITYRRVPTPGHRLVGIVGIFLIALAECLRGDYDAVASISLVPYGLYALAIGALCGRPVHLGIIGSDLDHHARQWYGPFVHAVFRRFDTVSVPGSAHADRLADLGVPCDRIHTLTNTIDVDRYRPDLKGAPEYDIAWVGRFSAEKRPLAIVDALAQLRARGVEFEAVMVGSGPMGSAVEERRAANGLESRLELTGWVDDPAEYYSASKVYVLTSAREGIPLTLLEAMAVGTPAVVPHVGSVTDAVSHGENGLVVGEADPEAVADAIERLLEDNALRERLASNAPGVRDSFSYDAARDDWRAILTSLRDPGPATA